MIVYNNSIYKTGVVWLDEVDDLDVTGVDIIKHNKSLKILPYPLQTSHTIKINMLADEVGISAGFNKNTRYEIRRAESDGLNCLWLAQPNAADIAAFTSFYDEFAIAKGLAVLNPGELLRYADAGKLALSHAQKNGECLVWHAYFMGFTTAVLLHSASLFRKEESTEIRQVIGRANRWLHWQDMLRIKANGIEVYDLGGWYSGETDTVLLQINKFKEGFGGEIVCEYSGFTAKTFIGTLVIIFKKLFGII
jgi:hypothetical protein